MQIPSLREWRERRALTQEELGELAGVSARSVAGYEAGAGARPGTVRKLAAALGISVEDLLGKAEAPPSMEQQSFNDVLREEEERRVYGAVLEAAAQSRAIRAKVEGLISEFPEDPDEDSLAQLEIRLQKLADEYDASVRDFRKRGVTRLLGQYRGLEVAARAQKDPGFVVYGPTEQQIDDALRRIPEEVKKALTAMREELGAVPKLLVDLEIAAKGFPLEERVRQTRELVEGVA